MTRTRPLPRPFISRSNKYRDNIEDSISINTYPATLDGPNGHEPAVAIRTGSRTRIILTPEGAIKLANQIADLIERMEAA
jgi:hypothetical protein